LVTWPPNKLNSSLSILLRTAQDWRKKIEEGKDIRKVEPGKGTKQTISEEIKKKVVRRVTSKDSAIGK